MLAAAFVVALALILVQVSFSRLISYKLFYHYVFLAISLSLLGLGAAGTFVAIRPLPQSLDSRIGKWLAAFAISAPIAFLLMANPLGVTHHPPIRTKLLGGDAIAYLLWCSPAMVWLNFCGGVVLASLFARFSESMGRLYAADLIGAAVGAVLAVGLMKFGSPAVAFLASGVLAAALLPTFFKDADAAPYGRNVAGIVAVASLILVAGIFLGPERLRNFENFKTAGKPLRQIIKYDWNHIIRTDHVPNWYVLDGEAATQIIRWTPASERRAPTKPAYAIAPENPSVAIIGVGGGKQLAEALRANASRITAIDINPTILGWVTGEDRELTGDLFVDPRVNVVVGDGRHAVRSATDAFDVIVIHAIDTYAAAAAGAYALTENFLYTKEAFQDYLRALSPDGVLTISRWLFNPPRENLRLFSTARLALAELADLGVENPLDHIAVIAPVADYSQLGDRRVWGYLLVSRKPFSAQALTRLQADAARKRWTLLYAPGVDSVPDTPFRELANLPDEGAGFDDFQAGYPYFVAPVTDSSPYLFQFYNPLRQASYRDGSRDWATVHIYQWSAISLMVTLVASALFSFLLIVAPLVIARRLGSGSAGQVRLRLTHAVYFACLGLGFMALEIPIIQVLSLYLGHPTYGLAVVLASLLLATGTGSLIADRLDPPPWMACAIVTALLTVVTVGLFALVHATLDLPDAARFTIALVILTVCGIPMGFPMAAGVRRVGRLAPSNAAWAWAVNGASSVIGACLVTIVMVYTSSETALALGTLTYGLGCAAALAWREE
jgi:spermidine synthase